MLQKYIDYLENLKIRLDGYFLDQKEFVKCKEGCDLCCKTSYYAVSRLEYEYIKIGIEKNYTDEQRKRINESVIKIFKDRKQFLQENSNVFDFSYECPLLVNGVCGIYEYRGLICRTHGLIYNDINNPNKQNIPHCMTLGLNYAEVFDEELNDFSEEKMVSLGIKSRPKAYDLSYTPLMQSSDGLDFGDIRMLFEWILMDLDNFQEIVKQ